MENLFLVKVQHLKSSEALLLIAFLCDFPAAVLSSLTEVNGTQKCFSSNQECFKRATRKAGGIFPENESFADTG